MSGCSYADWRKTIGGEAVNKSMEWSLGPERPLVTNTISIIMSDHGRFWPHVVGESRRGGLLLLAVIGLLPLFSGGFILEMVDIGIGLGWIGVAVGIAIAAGVVRAGLVPTIGVLWLFAFWGFVFPPLVGYLTGDWEMGSRYTYPRFLDYGYTSAHAELTGGIEQGITSGFIYSLILGTIGYFIGTAISSLSRLLTTN